MIVTIAGKLVRVSETAVTIEAPPFEYEVLVADYTRRMLQNLVTGVQDGLTNNAAQMAAAGENLLSSKKAFDAGAGPSGAPPSAPGGAPPRWRPTPS